MNPDYNFYPVDPLVECLSADIPVLTPNHRLARRIRLAWGHLQPQSAWRTPRVMSLEHWWQHCYRQRCLAGDELPGLLSPEQEQSLWLQCVGDSEQLALLRPSVAAQLAADAYRNLTLWNVDCRSAAMAQQFRFGEDSAVFLDWAEQFERRVTELGLATLASLVPTIAPACAEPTIWLAEFDELPPLYQLALEKQAGQLVQYSAGQQEARCTLQACPSHRDELEAAANWVFKQHQEDPTRRLGILMPQLQQERAEIERILVRQFNSDPRRPDSLPVNFSAGVPLTDCGPVEAALALLALPARDHSLAELGAILHSRYRRLDQLEAEQLAWSRLIDDAREPVPSSALRSALGWAREKSGAANDTGKGLLDVLLEDSAERQLRTSLPAHDWPRRFAGLLEQFGWPGVGPLDSLEFQQVEHFQSVLAGLSRLTPVSPRLDYRAALAALERLSGSAVFQAQTPDAPIQVLGTLEAAGLQFDAVWICNMSAADWPTAARPNPFVPVQLQRSTRMPHADAQRELDYADGLLRHLCRSTRVLVASYTSVDEDVGVAPSPLVAHFEALPERPVHHWPQYWPVEQESSLEHLPVRQAPPVSPDEADSLRGGSAILANQAQCPFRAFARHRLGAHPLPEPQVALGPADKGAILHDALYQLWGALGDLRSLLAMDAPARRLLCERSAESAIESFRQGRGRRQNPGLLRLEQARLGALLLDWLDVESGREEFEVIAREESHLVQFGELTVKLRVDRIDKLANGRQLLIDYKTGDAKTRQWLGQRPEDPQLPLYTRLLPADDIEGVSFAVLRHSATEYRGLARSEQGGGISDDIVGATSSSDAEKADWDALQKHWSQALGALAQEFLHGVAAVSPLDPRRTCNFCGLEALCRIR